CFGVEVRFGCDHTGDQVGVDAVALGRRANQVAERLLRNLRRRHGNKNFLWLDRQDLLDGNLCGSAFHLQTIFVAEDLVAGYCQPLPAAQHDVFGAHTRRGACQKKRAHGQVLQPHGATSRSANCSMAAATPLWSLEAVSCQPKFLSSGTQLPITTGMPAKESISRSL